MEVKKKYNLQRVRKTVLATNISLPKRFQTVSLFLDSCYLIFLKKGHPEFFLICVISMFAVKTEMIKPPNDSKSYRPNNEYIPY